MIDNDYALLILLVQGLKLIALPSWLVLAIALAVLAENTVLLMIALRYLVADP